MRVHRECVHYVNGRCTLYNVEVPPNGVACPNFMPKNTSKRILQSFIKSSRRPIPPSIQTYNTYSGQTGGFSRLLPVGQLRNPFHIPLGGGRRVRRRRRRRYRGGVL
ncbi:MAG: hypothetical protein J7L38_01485 [Thermoproteales archaeon]|nr:hypothetical protein [Thermoproteales archaeon]